jgi:hypothetical protein
MVAEQLPDLQLANMRGMRRLRRTHTDADRRYGVIAPCPAMYFPSTAGSAVSTAVS